MIFFSIPFYRWTNIPKIIEGTARIRIYVSYSQVVSKALWLNMWAASPVFGPLSVVVIL